MSHVQSGESQPGILAVTCLFLSYDKLESFYYGPAAGLSKQGVACRIYIDECAGAGGGYFSVVFLFTGLLRREFTLVRGRGNC